MNDRLVVARIMFVFVALAGTILTVIAAMNARIGFIVFGLVVLALGLVGVFYFARPKKVP